MPATVTHAFFAKDVCDILPNEKKKKLNLGRLVKNSCDWWVWK